MSCIVPRVISGDENPSTRDSGRTASVQPEASNLAGPKDLGLARIAQEAQRKDETRPECLLLRVAKGIVEVMKELARDKQLGARSRGAMLLAQPRADGAEFSDAEQKVDRDRCHNASTVVRIET